MRLEVQESPIDVTKREKLHFRFKLGALLEAGVSVTAAALRLVDEISQKEIAGVISDVQLNTPDVRCLVDFTVADVKADQTYLLFCKATLSAGEIEEVFARFNIFGI